MDKKESKMNIKKIVKVCLIAVGAYINLLALNKIIGTIGFSSVFAGPTLFGYNALQFMIYGVDIFLLVKFLNNNKRNIVFSAVCGFIMSILIVSGTFLLYTNDLFTGFSNVLMEFLTAIGLSFMTIPLWSLALDGMNKAEERYSSIKRSGEVKNGIGFFFAMWGIVMVCYLPFYLSQWPGNFIFDAADEMRDYNSFLITNSISTHHTVFHPLLMGGCCSLGLKLFDSISIGYGIYTTVQMLAVTGAFAYLLWYLRRRKIPQIALFIVFLFVAFMPVYKCFSITATKDVLCGAFSLIAAVGLMRLLYDKEEIRWYKCVGIILPAILSCMFRNNMIYAFVVGGLLLIIAFSKKWRLALLVFLLIAGIFVGQKVTDKVTASVVNVNSPDTYRESFSVPLQCLARVAAYRRDEIPKEQYDEILSYVPESNLMSYNPYLSDAVKGNANETLLKSNTLNFFKLWAKVGLEYPDEYIESVLSNTLAYWYPINLPYCFVMDFSAYHKAIENGAQIEKYSLMPSWVNDIYSYLYYENHYREVPILGFLFRPTLYVWTVLFGIVYSVYKKDLRKAAVFFIPLMYLGTLFLGPVVALRYVFPIITAMPVFAIVLLEKTGEKEQTN